MPTWGNVYWPWWLSLSVAAFLGPEIYALVTNWHNTLSDWVWRSLNVTAHHGFFTWSAADYLIFGVWLVLLTWLTGHFFFYIWR